MKTKLKSATLVLATNKFATIILSILTEKKEIVERRIKWDKSEDFWTAIKIGKTVLDVNIYQPEQDGQIKCAIYSTKQGTEGFLETNTSMWSAQVVKVIPFAEYEAMKK